MRREIKLDSDKRSFLIFGAGAIGTYIGASLLKSGQEVVFIEKAEACSRILESGMHLTLNGDTFHIPEPVVVDNIDDAINNREFDFGILAVKSFDTQSVLNELLPYRGQLPPIVCLQNGVENELMISKSLGDGQVIPGTVTSAIGRRDYNEIVVERLRGVGIAEGHSRVIELVKILNGARLRAQIYQSATAMKWSKMLTNLLVNASCAILGMEPDEILAHPGLYDIELAQLREALKVMETMGIPVIDLPGTPVRMLAMAARLPTRLSQPLLRKAIGGGRGGKMPSFYIDLHSGRGITEVEYLNGALVRYGARLGIPVSANRLLSETLQQLAQGDIPADSYSKNPEKLLKEWLENKL